VKRVRIKTINFNLITRVSDNKIECLLDYSTQLSYILTGCTASLRVYDLHDKLPSKIIPTFPFLQLQCVAGGVITAGVKLSDFGILGLNNDVAVMGNCQHGGRTMYLVKYQSNDIVVNKLKSLSVIRCNNLSCVTHFDFSKCQSLHSGHLEQLAIACPNLERLYCCNCLESL